MKFFIKKEAGGANAWPEVKNFWVKTTTENGFWSEVKKAWVKVSAGGATAWKQFWAAKGPKIDIEVELDWTLASSTKIITFTGTNHKWTTNTGETYYFRGDPNLSINLATGVAADNTSYTYELLPTDIVKDTTNHFQFAVKAVASSGAFTISESPSYAIDMPRPVSITSISGTSTITVNWSSDVFSNSYELFVKESTESAYQSLGATNSTSKSFSTLLTCPPGYSLAGNFCYGNAYPYPISSATSSNIKYNTTYNFRVMSFGGYGGTGYNSNYGPVSDHTTTATARSVCDPRFNPSCGSEIYVSYTQPIVNSNPTAGSSEGTICSTTLTSGYKYYQNETTYTCDKSPPTSVSGYSATCNGCSISASTIYDWKTSRTYYTCDGPVIFAAGNTCRGCEYDVTSYTCSPGSSRTCTAGPYTSTTNPLADACKSSSKATTTYTCNGSVITTSYPYNNCQDCGRSDETTYSCPSGSTKSGSGTSTVCTSNTYPYGTVTRIVSTREVCSPKANSETTYTYYQYEDVANCTGTAKATTAAGTGCGNCSVTSSTTQYCSPKTNTACDTANSGSTYPTTYCGSAPTSYIDYTCPSKSSLTCTAGPYFSTTNPLASACKSDAVSAYMYAKYGADAWSCDSTTHYYAAYGSDPACHGCLTYDYYGQ
jgi:hypothetical protein